MADDLGVMIAAVVIAVGVMMVAAGAISDFVEQHPTVKMLALSFLLLIGVSLVAEGFDQHIPKGYIYFAMGFSVFVEMINLRIRAMRQATRPRRRSNCGSATTIDECIRCSPKPSTSTATSSTRAPCRRCWI